MISIESGPPGVRTTAVRKVDVLIGSLQGGVRVFALVDITMDGLLSNGK
jgi:hypothetical protein